MTYAVKLDVYQGPLDLLLQLILNHRVDVADIPVARVTEEFLRAGALMGEVDLETASGFLILAATLLELKSLRLLPHHKQTDPQIKLLLEERDRLLHRLIVYASFKNAASVLEGLIDASAGYHYRVADLPQELIPREPDIFRRLNPAMVASAAAAALSPAGRDSVDTSHLTPVTVSLAEMVERLGARIQREGSSSFRALSMAASARMEVVISLLAVLELFRAQAIDLEQQSPSSDIYVSWLTR